MKLLIMQLTSSILDSNILLRTLFSEWYLTRDTYAVHGISWPQRWHTDIFQDVFNL